MVRTFPFGRPATERPPRPATASPAEIFVLGVYPSALHVRWRLPDGVGHVQALAVDDEPEVFWDGADADARIERWKRDVKWQASWGSVSSPSGNGSSGRGVVEDVLTPLGLAPDRVHFTDCHRRYLLKTAAVSQGATIDRKYGPFASAHGLPQASLPPYPDSDRAFVRMAIGGDDGHVLGQLGESGADLVVTLGQPAADVLGELLGLDRVVIRRDAGYGARRGIRHAGRRIGWLPLKHPGQRHPAWEAHHRDWAEGAGR